MEINNLGKKPITIISAIIISIVTGVAYYVGNSDDQVAQTVKKIVEQVLHKRLSDIDKRIDLNTEFRIDEYIKLIEKNANKIRKDPNDVKKSDIHRCIAYLHKIPEERKTEYIKAQIETVVNWAKQNP